MRVTKIEALKRLTGNIVGHWNIPLDPEHTLGYCRFHGNPDTTPVVILNRERNSVPTEKAIFLRILTRSTRSLKWLKGVWRQSAAGSGRLREVYGGFAPSSTAYQSPPLPGVILPASGLAAR